MGVRKKQPVASFFFFLLQLKQNGLSCSWAIKGCFLDVLVVRAGWGVGVAEMRQIKTKKSQYQCIFIQCIPLNMKRFM